MEEVKAIIQKALEYAGFTNFKIDVDPEGHRVSLNLDEGEWLDKVLPSFVNDLEHLARIIARKHGVESIFIDINYYRRERERLIADLAQAAARKAIASKVAVDLPALNAYERRLVHVELATRPDIKTESAGEGRDRHVVIRPISL